uniref:RING-type domain-containing protein n=1 Tax=Strigamia maritima TaxID=126957 RepID=T1JLM0_STRMM
MPIAASGQTKENSVGVPCFYHILPKQAPPNVHSSRGPVSPPLLASNNVIYSPDIRPEMRRNSPGLSMAHSHHTDTSSHLLGSRVPSSIPGSNLNSETHQRTSPQSYDFREYTQRRSLHDLHVNVNSPVSLSPSCYSVICAEESGRKSESPNRKRRRMSISSHPMMDLSSTSTPTPNRQWEGPLHDRVMSNRRRILSQRRLPPPERCMPNRNRRSPTIRHNNKYRERIQPWPSLPTDHRNFQGAPPTPPQHPHFAYHGFTQQPPTMGQNVTTNQQSILTNLNQVPVTIPLTLSPHNLPLYSTGHIPVCAASSHFAPCSMPNIHTCANLQFPTCQVRLVPQLAPCGMHVASHHPAAYPPLVHHHHPLTSHGAGHTHPPVANQLLPPPQFLNQQQPMPQPIQDPDVDVFSDRRSMSGFHSLSPGLLPSGPNLSGSSPVHLLHEPMVRSSAQDIPLGGFPNARRMSQSRRTSQRRWRGPAVSSPATSYPGFLLHFLAVLSNPTMPAFSQDMANAETTEAENYEALLTLAERLGDAKPRGLLKAEIEQLPSYRFNAETHQSDQTSCVICMCDFEQRQLLRVLPCNHEFHAKCVDKWLKTNRTCPICRGDASEYFNHVD